MQASKMPPNSRLKPAVNAHTPKREPSAPAGNANKPIKPM